nr:dihydrodipicolinate synthase family protein [Fodinibius saliphilus]
MSMNIDWHGVYPAITTKFNKDESLDLKTFRDHLRVQVEAGIHGIILAGSLGEASTLSRDEKLELLDTALDEIGNEIPVLLNIAERTQRDAIKLTQDAEAKGASGIMLLPPMQYKADDREVVAYFSAVAEATDLPILIYNNPVDYGIEVTMGMFEELISYDNIQAVKESTRDLTNVTRMKNRFGDRIKILCGVDTLAMEAMVMGACGWVAGLVSAFPDETVVIYELVKVGRIEEALKIYRWFMPLLELDINSKLVQNIKLAEVAAGVGTEHVRKPRLPLVGEELEHVQNVITDSLEKRPELPEVKQPVS